MDADFVVNQLFRAVLFIWCCGFVILVVVYYWRWWRYLRLYTQRQTLTDLRSKGNPWVDSLLQTVQSDPEVDVLRRKARRYLWYATIWLIALLPLLVLVVIYALASASGSSG